MAYQTVGSDAIIIYGLSTDTKPTGQPLGSLFIEEDTGLEFSVGNNSTAIPGNWFKRNQLTRNNNSETALNAISVPADTHVDHGRQLDGIDGTRQRVTWATTHEVTSIIPFVYDTVLGIEGPGIAVAVINTDTSGLATLELAQAAGNIDSTKIPLQLGWNPRISADIITSFDCERLLGANTLNVILFAISKGA